MNRKGIIGIVIAVPVLVVAGFVFFLLGQANELPWQTQPTAIPVTPFANIGGAAPAGTAVAASTATTAPVAAAATTAPAASAASAATPTYSGGTTASVAPVRHHCPRRERRLVRYIVRSKRGHRTGSVARKRRVARRPTLSPVTSPRRR